MIHHHLIHECGLNPVEVAVALKGWEILPFRLDDEVVGEVMLKGSEIHIAISKTFRRHAFTRRNLRAFIAPLLEQKKFLCTRTQPDNESQERFAKRLGFVKVKSNKQFTYWWLDSLPYEKEST